MDKFSYAIGLGIGQNLSSMGMRKGLAVDDFRTSNQRRIGRQSDGYQPSMKPAK